MNPILLYWQHFYSGGVELLMPHMHLAPLPRLNQRRVTTLCGLRYIQPVSQEAAPDCPRPYCQQCKKDPDTARPPVLPKEADDV